MTRWSTRALSAVVVLLAVVSVGLAAVGGSLFWDRVELQGEQATRNAVTPLAAEQIPKVFGYDYQTVEDTLTKASDLLTPAFRQEFQDRAAKQIIPEARDRRVVSQANVVGVGVLDAHRDSASVMVYMNRTVTDKSNKPVYDGSRLRVDYEKVDGKWLINYITPI
jgi:Mce-associated membrane protein